MIAMIAAIAELFFLSDRRDHMETGLNVEYVISLFLSS